MSILKKLSVIIPLVEALEKILGYAKLMKDLVMKKRMVIFEPTNNMYHCSAIVSWFLVEEKEDPTAFTIPCPIGYLNLAWELYEVGARINLMILFMYKELGLGSPKIVSMRLLMADRIMNKLVFSVMFSWR